jgi:hypothetical protein
MVALYLFGKHLFFNAAVLKWVISRANEDAAAFLRFFTKFRDTPLK